MIIISLIIIGVLLLIIGILIGIIYKKHLLNSVIVSDKIEVKNIPYNITAEIVSDGVKNAIREISYEDEQKKIFEKKKRLPDTIYKSISEDEEPVSKSDGDLIPFNLSQDEKDILEMFYGKSD